MHDLIIISTSNALCFVVCLSNCLLPTIFHTLFYRFAVKRKNIFSKNTLSKQKGSSPYIFLSSEATYEHTTAYCTRIMPLGMFASIYSMPLALQLGNENGICNIFITFQAFKK